MCGGGGGVVKALDNINNWHPLSGIVDAPVIDPYLQGDVTAAGDVRKGSYVDKKNENLGVSDMSQTATFFAKNIAGGLAGAQAGGAGAGAEGGAVGGESGSGTLIGGGGSSGAGGDPGWGGGELASSETLMPPAVQTMPPATVEADPTFGGNLQETSPGVFSANSPNATTTGTDPNQDAQPGTAQSGFLDGTTPVAQLSPETSAALGIESPTFGGADAAFGNPVSFTEGGGGSIPGNDYSIFTGETPTDMVSPVPDETLTPQDVTGAKDPSILDKTKAGLAKVGLSPTSAALLGIAGMQALSKPKTPQASRTLEGTSTAGSQQAQSVIQSGGQSSPSWTQQKAGIDATIDQQIQQQSQAILQQAQNSGQGADSQVTIQQINKLKTQLETQRQNLYAQAQGQNVQAALQQLGISDQALSGVAAAQYKASQDARSSAANTAQMALMLQALSNRSGDRTTTAGSILPQNGAPTG